LQRYIYFREKRTPSVEPDQPKQQTVPDLQLDFPGLPTPAKTPTPVRSPLVKPWGKPRAQVQSAKKSPQAKPIDAFAKVQSSDWPTEKPASSPEWGAKPPTSPEWGVPLPSLPVTPLDNQHVRNFLTIEDGESLENFQPSSPVPGFFQRIPEVPASSDQRVPIMNEEEFPSL